MNKILIYLTIFIAIYTFMIYIDLEFLVRSHDKEEEWI